MIYDFYVGLVHLQHDTQTLEKTRKIPMKDDIPRKVLWAGLTEFWYGYALLMICAMAFLLLLLRICAAELIPTTRFAWISKTSMEPQNFYHCHA